MMDTAQKATLGAIHGRALQAVDRLGMAAAKGSKAKPTMAELNQTVTDLEFIRDMATAIVAMEPATEEATA